MTNKEIVEILKKAANCTFIKSDNDIVYGGGAINEFIQVKGMTLQEYRENFYPKMVTLLESIPWTKIVKNPRNPQKEEYPNEEGYYLTMLDCNEHEISVNKLTKNNKGEFIFAFYHSTHIKWWLPLTEELKQEIIKQCEVENCAF